MEYVPKSVTSGDCDHVKQPSLSRIQLLTDHSLGVARFARTLAHLARPGDERIENEAWTAGLLHDLGKFQSEWQRWAREYQRRKSGIVPEQAIAHTDYDPRSQPDRQLSREVNKSVALTNPGDVRGGEEGEEEARAGQMGRKFTVSYGLYQGFGFVNPALAQDKEGLTGFAPADLDLFWEALANMFEHDRSASRGLMSCVELYVFEHANRLGNYHADRLFETIKVNRNQQAGSVEEYPTDRSCYAIAADGKPLPNGITLWQWDFENGKLIPCAS